jgi:oligosaccharide repeat unit polymerase
VVALIEVSLTVLGMVALARWVENSWLSPGSFFCLIWGGYALWGLQYGLSPEVLTYGVLWVLLSCVLVHGGCMYGRYPIDRSNILSNVFFQFPYLKTITLILTLVGLAEMGKVLLAPSSSLIDAVSFAYVNQLVMSNRAMYGYGPENQGILERIAFALTYAAPLFGGLLFASASTRMAKILGITSAFAPSFVGLLYGSRMGALYGGSFWISAYMAVRVLRQRGTQSMEAWSVVKALLIALVVIAGMSGLVILARYEVSDITSFQDILDNAVDIFVFFPVFSLWFYESGFNFSQLTLGNMTFGRIFDLLGLHIAENYYYRVEYEVGNTSANFFTIFRGLIDDFGHIGAVLVILLFGVVAGVAYKRVLNKQALYLPVLIAVYAGIFTSLSLSLFMYVTPVIALGIFAMYFAAFHREIVPIKIQAM